MVLRLLSSTTQQLLPAEYAFDVSLSHAVVAFAQEGTIGNKALQVNLATAHGRYPWHRSHACPIKAAVLS